MIRRANPADRRVNVLVVTPRGTKTRDELIHRLFEPPEAFRRLPAKEQTRLRDLMLAAVTDARPPLRASGLAASRYTALAPSGAEGAGR